MPSQQTTFPRVSAGKPIRAQDINALQASVEYLMRNVQALQATNNALRGVTVTVKILSNATGGEKYNAEIIGPPIAPIDPKKSISLADIGDIPSKDFSNALFTNTIATAGATTHSIAKGTLCTGTIVGFTSEAVSRVEVNGSQKSPILLCDLTGNSGSNGVNKTTDCARTYDIKPPGGSTALFTNISPLGPPRIAKLHYADATTGFFWMKGSTPILFTIDEKPDGAPCST